MTTKPRDFAIIFRILKLTGISIGALLLVLGLFALSTIWIDPWWRSGRAPTPEEWSALWGLVGTVAAVGAAGIALVTLVIAWRQLAAAIDQFEKAQDQVRQESEDRNRPYLVTSISPSLSAAPSTWDLVVRNTGGSTARNIQVSLLDGELESNDRPGAEFTEMLSTFLSATYELAPGATLRVYWSFAQEGGNPASGAPAQGTVKVDYTWDGDKTRDGLSETLRYDLDILGAITPVPGTGPRRQLTGEKNQMLNIESALRAMSKHLAELRR